jgi:palmitoyltransferase
MIRKKLKTLKEWDREWGKWSTEGNIWWIGPRRGEWEAVMGTNPLGWICGSNVLKHMCFH